ncbi:hypothetical protein D9M69_620330 [compost metagenome]
MFRSCTHTAANTAALMRIAASLPSCMSTAMISRAASSPATGKNFGFGFSGKPRCFEKRASSSSL